MTTFENAHTELLALFLSMHHHSPSDATCTIVDLSTHGGLVEWFWNAPHPEIARLVESTPIRSPFPRVIFGLVAVASDDETREAYEPAIITVESRPYGSMAAVFANHEWNTPQSLFELHEKPDGTLSGMRCEPSNDDDPDNEYPRRTATLVACALAMFHVKNIELRPHPIPRYVRRQAQRSGSPATGPTTYHTLVLRPFRKSEIRDTANRHWENAGGMPLHLVRGNFARYSEDHPLFGRFPGTFWRPSHMAGNRERGNVRKTYHIQPEP